MSEHLGEGKKRKRLLKYAQKISDKDVIEYLTALGTPLENYYLYGDGEFLCLGYWDPSRGPMEVTIDDEIASKAISDYLVRINATRVHSDSELEQVARQKNWSRINP